MGFELNVAPGGYAWWYLDAISEDGEHGLTLIAFIGSVFSPYYARARRRAGAAAVDPLDHCAVNVALYGRGARRWAMTERGRHDVSRDADGLQIGPSSLEWHDDALCIRLDERAVPWPARIRGTVRVHAPVRFHRTVALASGHRWRPIAPAAWVEVELDGLRWRGRGYLDTNHGNAPLEQAFTRWDWSRAHLAGGRSGVIYEVEPRAAAPFQLGLAFDAKGGMEALEPMPRTLLPSTRWGVERHACGDVGTPVRVVQTLTDAPFYARSIIGMQWLGEPVTGIHESLSLTRFDSAWVQAMLPFRMPRRTVARRP